LPEQSDSTEGMQPQKVVRRATGEWYRAGLLDATRSRPAALLRLKQFLEKGPKDRAQPLRYLASYLSDQLKLNAVGRN